MTKNLSAGQGVLPRLPVLPALRLRGREPFAELRLAALNLVAVLSACAWCTAEAARKGSLAERPRPSARKLRRRRAWLRVAAPGRNMAARDFLGAVTASAPWA